MEVDNSEVKKRTCFWCRSEDYFIRNCLRPDGREKKNNIWDMKAEKDEKETDNENGWGNLVPVCSAGPCCSLLSPGKILRRIISRKDTDLCNEDDFTSQPVVQPMKTRSEKGKTH